MLELAEDEQEYFIELMTKKALSGKRAVDKPMFTAIMGMPGTGKSTLSSKLKNTVIISGDDIMTEYCKTLGIDITDEFFDKDVSRFIEKVNGEIINEAMRRDMNIAYDTASVFRGEEMIEEMQQKGYNVQAKIMLADKYQAVLNTIDRKYDVDEKYTQYKRGERKTFPKGNTRVGNLVAAPDSFERVVNFIKMADTKSYPIEVYEFGKDGPSFKTGDNADKFFENLDLTPNEDQIKRAEKLVGRANILGKEDDVMGLNYLKNRMKSEKQ